MIQLKSRVEGYKLSLPQSPREIPASYYAGVVESINLPKHYAVIAIVRQVRMYDFIFALSNSKAKLKANDIAILAKVNEPDLPETFAVGQQVIIDESAVSRGTQIAAPCALSADNVASYFAIEEKAVSEKEGRTGKCLTRDIMGGEAKDSEGCPVKDYPICIMSFKIVPIVDIKGTVDGQSSFQDPFATAVEAKQEEKPADGGAEAAEAEEVKE